MHKCFGATISFNKFVIAYCKTFGAAFAAILKHLFYLETGVFVLAKYLRFTVWKISPDGVKMRKGSLASAKHKFGTFQGKT